MKRYLPLACLLLSACAGLPAAIKNVPVTDISYSEASQNLKNHEKTSVRWGGVIVDVENEQNFTLLQILSYPLNYYGRPQLNKSSEGRFVIRSHEFLDPAVYEKDKEITVAGTIDGDIERTIGKRTVRLPLIASAAIHIWPDYYAHPYGYGYGYGYRGFGYGFSPYYGYGYFGGPYWGYPYGGFYGPYW